MEFKSQDLISDSYSHSHKAVSVWGEGPKIYFFLNLMLNLKNNETYIRSRNEIKFQGAIKMNNFPKRVRLEGLKSLLPGISSNSSMSKTSPDEF